jgi:hypothetical protein
MIRESGGIQEIVACPSQTDKGRICRLTMYAERSQCFQRDLWTFSPRRCFFRAAQLP